MGKLNYPAQQQPKLEPGELAVKINTVKGLSDWEFTNDPDLVEKRIDWFFKYCAERDIRPTVALLAVALNTSRQTLWGWEQKGGRLGNSISQAKRVLNALLEDWEVTGRINPVAAIWLQKNHFLYRETFSVELSDRPRMLTASMTPEQIQQRLSQDIPLDLEELETAEIKDF